jgi:hypothetical protein
LDAADTSSFVLSGANVSRWNDKSGNNRFGVATGNPQVGRTTTGKQAIVFGGSDFFKLSNNITTTSGASTTLFIVASATTNGRNLIHFYGNERIISFQLYYNNAVGNLFFSTNTIFLNQNQICCIVENVGVRCSVFFNGNLNGSQVSSSVSVGSEVVVGAHGNYTNGWIGNIQEVISYNTALSSENRQQIEGYLAWKWGLQTNLSSTHPYAKFPPPA